MKTMILAGRRTLSVFAALLLLLFMANLAMAKTTSYDAQLKKDIAAIDGDAAISNQAPIVVDRIAKEFKVPTLEVTSLGEKLTGLGEVAAVYAFADKMRGGVTPENVNTVITERQLKKDWDEIAAAHDVMLKDVSSKVTGIYKDAHKDIKHAAAGKAAKGKGAGGRGY